MQLRLRLAFNQRKAGILRFPNRSMDVQLSDGRNEPIVLDYANSEAFLDQLEEAQVTGPARAQIRCAVSISSISPGKICWSEEVELSDRQVLFLLAGAKGSKGAGQALAGSYYQPEPAHQLPLATAGTVFNSRFLTSGEPTHSGRTV